jgi:hypothetical protein
MRIYTLPSLTLALLLAGCDKAPSPGAVQTNGAATAAGAVASHTATQCPATEFDAFLPLFENDVTVQKAYVADPLQSDSVDANAEPEPKPVSRMLVKAEVTFPVMPSQAAQARDGLTTARADTSATEAVLKLTKPDTDYQMSFFFRKDDCWHLYRVKDDSL